MKKRLLAIFCLLAALLCGCSLGSPSQPSTATPFSPAKTPAAATQKPSAQASPSVLPTNTPSPVTTPPSGQSLAGLVIGIDAGHQGKGNPEKEPVAPGSSQTKAKVTSGATGVSSKVPEHEINLQVALKLRDLLVAKGAKVIMTRESAKVNISNIERATMMNKANAHLVVRIHCNGSDNENVHGAYFMVPGNPVNASIHAQSKKAGQILQQAFVAKTGAKNLPLAIVQDLTGLNWSTVPTCLIEMGFLSNPQEDQKLASASYQTLCAQGLYDGIIKYFDKA